MHGFSPGCSSLLLLSSCSSLSRSSCLQGRPSWSRGTMSPWKGHCRTHSHSSNTHPNSTGTGRDLQEVSWYLEAVLSLAQLSPAKRGSAVMADRSEAPGEGDVSAPALCLQLLVLPLLVHINGNPELMLRGRPAQGQDTGPAGVKKTDSVQCKK